MRWSGDGVGPVRIPSEGDPRAGPSFLLCRTMRIHRNMVLGRLLVLLVSALGGSAAGAGSAETAVADPPQVVGTPGYEDAAPSGSVVAAAQDLAAVTVGGAPAGAAAWIAALPEGTVDALGYVPVTVDGMPADPEGDCSSPVPLPASFTPACLTHDLGYDLLRLAADRGETVPAGVRPALDRQLAARMVSSCGGGPVSRAGCRVAAEVADAVVTANSWRQGDGVPVAENFPWS